MYIRLDLWKALIKSIDCLAIRSAIGGTQVLSLGVSVAPLDAPVSLTVTASFVLSWSWTDIDPAVPLSFDFVIQRSDAGTTYSTIAAVDAATMTASYLYRS